MTKEEFIRQFVVQFLATWTATNYNDFCARDMHSHLETPPVEDAFFLAEAAWLKVDAYKGL